MHTLSQRPRGLRALAVTATTALLLTGCAALGGDTDERSEDGNGTLVVATHDSWNMSDEVIEAFEEESGLTLKIQPQGDAGQLTNKLVLTKDNPVADVAFGIDNTFASRAVDEGVVQELDGLAIPASAQRYQVDGEGRDRLMPVDYGDVCVNIDDTWFAKKKLAPPKTLDDLTRPAYKGLFVTPGASSSSPGMAFLLTTVAEYGDDWPAYWEKLVANDVKVTSGWSDAYEVDFTAGGGDGDRPIVLSYSSSPPFTVPEGGSEPTTSALLDTCFRQVEYAAVLENADNPEGARKFVQFLVEEQFQSALPENMYVYPVLDSAEVPEDWAKLAPPAPEPHEVPADEIAAQRSSWLTTWRDIVTG